MHIFSYSGCNECVVKSCCSDVCIEYKDCVLRKHNMMMPGSAISLESAERMVFDLITSEARDTIRMAYVSEWLDHDKDGKEIKIYDLDYDPPDFPFK